mmetsp:Transcript_9909/g.25187  ORF Transcript_9909/g.25187 Transcript_9909/m.25187 type:complete len:141 (-) Transcript_9909:53-475(-)
MMDEVLFDQFVEMTACEVVGTMDHRSGDDLPSEALLSSLGDVWSLAARLCMAAPGAVAGRLRAITRDMFCVNLITRVVPVDPDAAWPTLPRKVAVTTAPAAESDWGFFVDACVDDDDVSLDVKVARRRAQSLPIGRPIFR